MRALGRGPQSRIAALCLQALQCLVNILRSLVEWYTRSVADAAPADSQHPVPEGNVSTSADVKESWSDLTSTPEQMLPNGDAAHPDPGRSLVATTWSQPASG